MKELWNECSGYCWCGRNKRGMKEKTKEGKNKRKECGYVGGGEKKSGKKRRREGEPTCVCVWGEKKNYITIFLQ